MDPQIYCKTPSTLRVIPHMTCCAPERLDGDVRFRVFAPDCSADGDLDWRSTTLDDRLNNNRNIMILAHGWTSSFDTSEWMHQSRDILVQRGWVVIAPDYPNAVQLHYFQAVANARVIGMMIGHMICNWQVIAPQSV